MSTRVEPATSKIAAAAAGMHGAAGPPFGSAPVTGGASSGRTYDDGFGNQLGNVGTRKMEEPEFPL